MMQRLDPGFGMTQGKMEDSSAAPAPEALLMKSLKKSLKNGLASATRPRMADLNCEI